MGSAEMGIHVMKRKCLMLFTALGLAASLLAGCASTPSSREKDSESRERREEREEKEEKKDKEEKEDGKETSGEASSTDDGRDQYTEEERDNIKYNIYVELNNQMLDVMENIDLYFTIVKEEEEFSIADGYDYSYFSHSMHGFDEDLLADALTVSDWTPEYAELDEAVKEIAEPLLLICDTCDKIDSSPDYADDQYALAKEWHEIMWEWGGYVYNECAEFMDLVDEMASEQILIAEQGLLEDGLMIQYYSSHAMTLIEQILDECFEQGVSDVNLNELDLTAITPLYEELEETVAAYETACQDSNQVMKESLNNSAPFDGLLNLMLESAEYMMDSAEQGVVYDGTESPLGSINFIYEAHGKCVDRYNSVFVGD